MLIVGAVFTVFLIVYVSVVVRRYLNQTAERVELEEKERHDGEQEPKQKR